MNEEIFTKFVQAYKDDLLIFADTKETKNLLKQQ
jgi:hypothetical protein